MRIRLTYGKEQTFRYRTRDLNIIGRVENATHPFKISHYSLNGGQEVYFYVESVPDPGIDWTYMYKDSPAVNRLKDQGDFNVEIPVNSPELSPGKNDLMLLIEDANGETAEINLKINWDPNKVPLPLDLSDLFQYTHIQEIGQVVNGAFDIDRDMNLIRSRAPVYPDALCVLGSVHGNQEATYNVRFTDFTKVKWLGPSDFFVGMEGPKPPLGIKPGWSTFGMMNIDPRWAARAFLAFGDHSDSHDEWVVQTCPPKRFIAKADFLYSVRHQAFTKDGINTVRFKIWPAIEQEPSSWLIEENDSAVDPQKPRFTAGSFSLFQHSGFPIEWSKIKVKELKL